MTDSADILVIGAGMTGLAAARELGRQGQKVLVVDKGRGLGGRLAGKRFGDAVFDNGAQYVTARDPRFAALLKTWNAAGAAEPWNVMPRGEPDGRVRWTGRPAMTALAKMFAADLTICSSVKIHSVHQRGSEWNCLSEEGRIFNAEKVLLTVPVPQALDLLGDGRKHLNQDMVSSLETITYHPCFSVMAVLEQPSRLPPGGGLRMTDGPVAWMADNQVKGISKVPAVTIHASPAYSLERWEWDRDEIAVELLAYAEPWLGSPVVEHRIHGWKFSRPVEVQGESYLVLNESPRLVIAGDAFGGGRVEGAVLSGWAAASALG